MRDKLIRYGTLTIALLLAMLCICVFTIYAKPMEDVSLDLSLVPNVDNLTVDPENFDNKGWTVYTQEGETRTELTPTGLGNYSGLELGQTFYLSRVLNEELDNPTLRITPVEWQFAVWLNDELIYTDCPTLDNRIGYLHLPMNDWYRETPILISLPADYHGKTLTIAQSSPEQPEANRIEAFPASIMLACGYAYESGLISETFQISLIAMLILLLTLFLLAAFVRHRDWSFLCLAMVAFCRMIQHLMEASFFYKYYDPTTNSVTTVLPQLSSLGLFCFLALQGGKRRKWLWPLVSLYALSLIGYTATLKIFPYQIFRGGGYEYGLFFDKPPALLACLHLPDRGAGHGNRPLAQGKLVLPAVYAPRPCLNCAELGAGNWLAA